MLLSTQFISLSKRLVYSTAVADKLTKYLSIVNDILTKNINIVFFKMEFKEYLTS